MLYVALGSLSHAMVHPCFRQKVLRYSGKFSRVQIFAKIPFPLQKKFSNFRVSLRLRQRPGLLGVASGVSPKGSTILLESKKRKLSDDLPEPEGEKWVRFPYKISAV